MAAVAGLANSTPYSGSCAEEGSAWRVTAADARGAADAGMALAPAKTPAPIMAHRPDARSRLRRRRLVAEDPIMDQTFVAGPNQLEKRRVANVNRAECAR
jgi:hypothetical protein